ncbi:MAG: DNA polymerase III subunit gamma/tau [Bacteroidetes bacterium OLB12]|nr:MAG: DNA polymerase III subunit gamma/tau [Bacteroidetes bacterium OLB12]
MENFVVSARKYRPLGFEEVVGQEHITTTLKNAIDNNKLAQALLFCGPRGVGKTTCARIVARMINGFEERAEVNSLNIFELDAASNNGVDDIRNLTEQVRYPPQFGKFKVYIIDEVHMLTTQAFNAFLKTLEEPPPYAIFILATTEKHKVIPTILSRCQIFDFNRIQVSDISRQLKKVADREKIKVEEEALHLIAQKADGALRDALSIFDLMVTFSSGNEVTFKNVLNNLHILDHDYYFKVVDGMLSENHAQPLLLLDEILKKGFDGHNFIVGLSEHLRNLLVAQDARTVDLMDVPESTRKKYLEQAATATPSLLLSWLNIANQCDLNYKGSKNQRLLVELALMKMAHVNSVLKANGTAPVQEGLKKNEPVTNTPAVESNAAPASAEAIETVNLVAKVVKEPIAKTADERNKPRTTINLSNLLKGKVKEETVKPVVAPEKENKPVKESELIRVWNEFAELRKTQVAEYHLLKQAFTFSNNVISLTLTNPVEEPLLHTIKSDLLTYLRDNLNNDLIQLDYHFTQFETKRVAYTNKEKFEALVQKNPSLKKLQEKFGLDPEF